MGSIAQLVATGIRGYSMGVSPHSGSPPQTVSPRRPIVPYTVTIGLAARSTYSSQGQARARRPQKHLLARDATRADAFLLLSYCTLISAVFEPKHRLHRCRTQQGKSVFTPYNLIETCYQLVPSRAEQLTFRCPASRLVLCAYACSLNNLPKFSQETQDS